jgi:hypothetical protein
MRELNHIKAKMVKRMRRRNISLSRMHRVCVCVCPGICVGRTNFPLSPSRSLSLYSGRLESSRACNNSLYVFSCILFMQSRGEREDEERKNCERASIAESSLSYSVAYCNLRIFEIAHNIYGRRLSLSLAAAAAAVASMQREREMRKRTEREEKMQK